MPLAPRVTTHTLSRTSVASSSHVTPKVGDGHHPGKAVVGEVVPNGASVWREGHDAIAANVVW